MTNNDSVVEQIVRSLSFEVIAVPSKKVVDSCSSKSTPVNVKIKVKKKDGDLQQGVLAASKLGPDGIPQTIRFVSSDHTIMSFNVVMEDADLVNSVSSRKPVIPNLPIDPGTHDGPYNQTTNQTYKADIKESRTSQSDGALKSTFTLTKVEDDKRLNTSSSRAQKKDIIFGKCKPGGCLDPPFGEDKYSYEPARESLPNPENVVTTRPRTSSIFSNKLFNKKKKAKTDKSSASRTSRSGPRTDEQGSISNLYQGDSLQTSATLSNSLITYPSIVNDDSDIKQKLPARNFETISKKSIDINGGSLYIIPRKNKISTELNDSPNLDQKDNKEEQNFTSTVVIPQENYTYVKPVQQMATTEPDGHKELESSDFIKADSQTEDKIPNDMAESILTGYNTVAPYSINDFEPHIVSDTSQLNEKTSHQNHFAETTQAITGVVTTGIITAGVISMAAAEKEKTQEATAKPDETVEEKAFSDVETETRHIFTNPADGNDKGSHETLTMTTKPDKSPSSKSIDDNIENISNTEKVNIFTNPADGNDKGSHETLTMTTKPDKSPSSKSIDDNIENISNTEKVNIFTNPADGNDKGSHETLTMTTKPDKSPSRKSIDDNIENISNTEKVNNMDNQSKINEISSDMLLNKHSVTAGTGKIIPLKGQGLGEKLNFNYMESQDQGTKNIDARDSQTQVRTELELDGPVVSNTVSNDITTTTLNSIATVDIDLQRGWMDGKETIDFNISFAQNSSDILQDELQDKTRSGEGLGEEFKNVGLANQDPAIWVTDDMGNQNRSKTEPQSDQQIKYNTVPEDSDTNKINLFSTAASSIEKNSSVTVHDSSSNLVNDKIMPLKPRNLEDEFRYGDMDNVKQTGSEFDFESKQSLKQDFGKNTLNSFGTVDLDLHSHWKDSKETLDFNLAIDNHNLTPNKEKYNEKDYTTNGSVQKRSQELLNKNVRDSNLDKDTYKKTYTDEDSIQIENDNNELNVHTSTDSFKERNRTDSSSKISMLKHKTSKQNESIFSDTKKEENFDQPTLAQDDSLLKEKLKDAKLSDTDHFDKYETRDKESDVYYKKNKDSDNVSRRSKSSVSFDDVVKKNDIKKLKSTPEINTPIKIDLGFHSYTSDKNEIIIKSFDSKSVLNRHPKDAIIMASCNVRDPFEIKVPIDNNNLLLIQVKNNTKDDSDVKQPSVFSKYSDRRPNSTKRAIKPIQEADKHADVSKLSEVYEKVYENEFGQFHEMIKKLKQEVDGLIHKQNEFKANLRSRRIKQFKLLQGNKKCVCSKKI